MTATKAVPKSKPAAKAEAAQREAAGVPPVADFHGVKISLPSKLPASFSLRYGKLQHAPEEQGLGALYGLLVGLIGSEQLDAAMDKMDALGGDADVLINELMESIIAPYGVEPGEANASAGS